jgi:hypothetical protein
MQKDFPPSINDTKVSLMEKLKFYDVVLFPTPKELDAQRRPIRRKFDLSSDLRIDILSRSVSKIVFESCEPPGYNFNPVRQYGQLYSFIRDIPPIGETLHWDPDQRLQYCVALSRIVHPTTVSFEFAARICENQNGEVQKVVPGPVYGSGSLAFVIDPKHNFLVEDDVKKLKVILSSLEKNPLKDPVAMALWYHEYASRSFEMDIRWPIITTGLEALIHTDRHQSTRQFVNRVIKLAERIGSIDISSDEAGEMYDLRSALSHGQGLGNLAPEKNELYEKMERLLRLVIKMAILDTNLNAFLSDPDRIRAEWPV